MRVLTRKAKAGGNPVRSNMLRDITLGQYYQTESVIHKMDPRVKLGGTLLFIISLFFFKNYAGYVIAALFLGMVIRLSKVPFRFMVKGMKTIVMLMMITVVFNLFLTQGTPLFTIWKLTITQEGLKMAISMAIRLTLLIIGSSVMTLTTTPNNLTDGMEKMMGPLKVFKVPVHEVAMMMSIALRFIPILLEETDKIMKHRSPGERISRAATFSSVPRPWCPCWCLCLFLRSAEPMIWLWLWKPDAIAVARAERR